MPNAFAPKLYQFNGTQLTVKEIANLSKVPITTLYQRIAYRKLQAGESVDELTKMKGKAPRKKSARVKRHTGLSKVSPQEKLRALNQATYVYDGNTLSIDELCTRTQYSPIAIHYILRGSSLSDDCKSTIDSYRRGRGNIWSYENMEAATIEIAEWVNKTSNHLSIKLWHRNLEPGADVTSIANEKSKSRRSYIYKGVSLTAKAIANKTGLRYGFVRDKLRSINAEDGMDVTHAITILLKHHKH